MMKMMNKLILTALLAGVPLVVTAKEHVVSQKNKSFSSQTLSIKVGDKVAFRNDDAFAHNVFSLSEPSSFDLGTYPQGQSKSVAFDKPGKFEIECAIHPEMKLVISVAP